MPAGFTPRNPAGIKPAARLSPWGTYMNPRRVGLIGLGLLGTALAERLVAGGYGVCGYDIDPARVQALVGIGGRAAKCADDVVRDCDCLLLSLPTTNIVERVLSEVATDLLP